MIPPAFSRAEPDARRQSLIEATARVLAERGASGLSVRHVAVAASVSPGLVSHYFDGVDELIAETYRHVCTQVAVSLDAALTSAGSDPLARLNAYVTANFAPPIADVDLLATWISFWSLMRTNAGVARLHEEQYAATRKDIEQLLLACGVSDDPRPLAIAISALIDGLWLELCLSPDTFSASEASAIARQQVGALIGRPR